MESIRIAKKYVVYQENAYTSEYVVTMPKKSAYSGYNVKVPSLLLQDNDYFYTLKKPWTDTFVFLLTKAEREQGKRYARHKLNFDKLAEALKIYHQELDVSNLPLALVKFNEYTYSRHGIEEDRETVYCVGRINDTWFYETSGERHLVKAKHFALLHKNLSPEEADFYMQQIEEMARLEKQIQTSKKREEELKRFSSDLQEPWITDSVKQNVFALRESIGLMMDGFNRRIEEIKQNFDKEEPMLDKDELER